MKGKSRFFAMVMGAALCMTGCAITHLPSETPAKPIVFDSDYGYTESMPLRLEIANFKYGAEMPYGRYNESGNLDWNARSFAARAPVYSYQPNASEADLEYKAEGNWMSEDSDDSCNYFTVYGSKSGSGKGTVTADYLMYIPALDEEGAEIGFGKYPKEYENYLDLSAYDTLYFDMSSTSSDKRDVSYTISWKNHGGQVRQLYEYKGKSGQRQEIAIDISRIPQQERTDIELLRFVQNVPDISMNGTIEMRLHSIRAEAEKPTVTREENILGMEVYSEYLGNVLYTKWGAYSASGFYDSEDKKIKIWYGAGIPERDSSDNVYYIECSDLSEGFSKPKRIVTDDSTGYKLVDPTGKLKSSDEQIGYGGDPSVIKVNGTYYMYFSALENGLDDGTYTHWNKVYVATSTDSKLWTVAGVAVDCHTGGVLGYGAGGPSVVYKDGEFWLYYYTQAPDYRYPDEPCGFVLKKSTDGVNFGKGIELNTSMSALDVKYIPSLRKWVGTYYAEANQFIPDAKAGVRIAFSDNGVDWSFDHSNDKMIAQNFDYPINHNPGFIGNELGQGYETMFLMYGANDLPLTVDGYWFSAAQYDARQLEWSRITIR